jgi:LacI family transcriptional regulator
MYKPVTIKDIANTLNLSCSTVSRSLRNGYGISAQTVNLVKEYAKKVNYRPNPIAVNLKSSRSHSIGVIVPTVADSFFSQAIAGIESVAYEKGYSVLVSQTHEMPERELDIARNFAQRSVDGLLMSMSSGTSDYSSIKNLNNAGLPIVFFDRTAEEFKTFTVASDNFGGAYNATEWLIKAGRKNIALFTNVSRLSVTKERLSGYKKALKDHQIAFRPELINTCGKEMCDYQQIENKIKKLMAMENKPDAIFITSDQISLYCIRALHNLKLNSQELMIAGFSNSDVIDLLEPSLTYIRQKAFEIGQAATEMLIKVIENDSSVAGFECRLLQTELHIATQKIAS